MRSRRLQVVEIYFRNMVEKYVRWKVIASLIDVPLTSAKNYGRPNSSQSEKLIRN